MCKSTDLIETDIMPALVFPWAQHRGFLERRVLSIQSPLAVNFGDDCHFAYVRAALKEVTQMLKVVAFAVDFVLVSTSFEKCFIAFPKLDIVSSGKGRRTYLTRTGFDHLVPHVYHSGRVFVCNR
jgi:hypothetical protein